MDKERIANEECINKDVPNSCCQGKCYLENQIKAQAEKEANKTIPVLKEIKELVYFYTSFNFEFKPIFSRLTSVFQYNFSIVSTIIPLPFKPPRQ